MKDKSVILNTIREWHCESKNFRNDGWVQSHFRNQIEEVTELINSFELKQGIEPKLSENTQEEDFVGTLEV